ncbi:MAG TPA: hypothetical protein VHX13_04195 [Acidobacteriaceae bacterium]|jgi:hypothetical protein|nr:hypothetical protein [Acidobacteriaceae bacterium]
MTRKEKFVMKSLVVLVEFERGVLRESFTVPGTGKICISAPAEIHRTLSEMDAAIQNARRLLVPLRRARR